MLAKTYQMSIQVKDKDAKIIDNFHDILSDNIKTLDE